MNPRRLLISCAAAAVILVPRAAAHRLDEYLQATRLSIDIDRVDLEIDLTPGVAIAPRALSWIDSNQDGEISKAEGEAYARLMLSSVELSVDGRPVPVTLVDTQFPELSDIKLGVGIIKLRAIAQVPGVGAGSHQLTFLNKHQPESSVYLVNALVPANPRIKLADQRRDRQQHGLTLDYTVDGSSGWRFPLWAGLAGLVLIGRLVRRTSNSVAKARAA